jgi:hypothetical protein
MPAAAHSRSGQQQTLLELKMELLMLCLRRRCRS